MEVFYSGTRYWCFKLSGITKVKKVNILKLRSRKFYKCNFFLKMLTLQI